MPIHISHVSVTSARKYDRVKIVIFLAKPETNEHVARLKRRMGERCIVSQLQTDIVAS